MKTNSNIRRPGLIYEASGNSLSDNKATIITMSAKELKQRITSKSGNGKIALYLNQIAMDIYTGCKKKNIDTNAMEKHRNLLIRKCIKHNHDHSFNFVDITNFLEACFLLAIHSDYKPEVSWFTCGSLNYEKDPYLLDIISNEPNIQNQPLNENTNINKYLESNFHEDLFQIPLPRRSLKDCDLSNANFVDFYLFSNREGFEFSNCNFTNANFANYNSEKKCQSYQFEHVKFSNCDFTNANFDKLQLTGVQFIHCNLTNCSFREGKHLATRFEKCIFNNNDFAKTEFEHTRLENIPINDIEKYIPPNFTNTIFYESSITGDWQKSNFSDTKFNSSILRANLNYAIFYSAKFNFVTIGENVTFFGAVFDNNSDFSFPASEEFIPFAARGMFNSEWIFKTINSIDDKYPKIKKQLILTALDFLKDQDITYKISHFIEALSNDSYLINQAFVQFPKLVVNFFEAMCAEGNIQSLDLSPQQIECYLKVIRRTIMTLEEPWLDFCRRHNGFLIQLIHQAKHLPKDNEYDGLKDIANAIYVNYLIAIEFYEAKDTNGDSIEKILNSDIYCGNPYTVLTSLDDHRLMLVAPDYIEKFLYNKGSENSKVDWENVMLLTPVDHTEKVFNIESVKELDLIGGFRLFLNKFIPVRNTNGLIKLINLLNLGKYHQSFVDATLNSSSSIKYVKGPDQVAFINLFKGFMGEEITILGLKVPQLNNKHIEDIIKCYRFHNKSLIEQSELLILLAGIFARYSSSRMFGTEDESPNALRAYACGLLVAAVSKSTRTIANKTTLSEWLQKMLGQNGRFECTEILSRIILEYCRQKFENYEEELKGIIPSGWLEK